MEGDRSASIFCDKQIIFAVVICELESPVVRIIAQVFTFLYQRSSIQSEVFFTNFPFEVKSQAKIFSKLKRKFLKTNLCVRVSRYYYGEDEVCFNCAAHYSLAASCSIRNPCFRSGHA